VKAEPVKAEPVKAEPVKAKPVKAKPVKAEPVKAEPVKAKSSTKARFALDSFALKRNQKEAMQEAKAKTQQQERGADKPFVGVKWPDGAVTVRLATGGAWSLSRTTQDAVPPEVDVACSWSSF